MGVDESVFRDGKKARNFAFQPEGGDLALGGWSSFPVKNCQAR